jgi:hypothetical protein
LGEGARIKVGQTVGTPGGLRAEIERDDGSKVRLDEHARVTVTGEGVELLEGRVIVLGGPGPAQLVAAGERLSMTRGRAQVVFDGGKREYSVIEGHGTLTVADRTIELTAGSVIETPIEAKPAGPVAPVISLAPLQDSTWAKDFERAKALATTLPPGVGSLTARRPNSQARSQPLRITDQRVRVTIKGRVAHTEIEQAFHNDAGQELEGTYRFPIPSDASISGLQLLVGSRWMEGEMLEKTRARAIFKSIVDRVIPRDPALLEWEQGSVFKLKVFPIPARGERRVRLSYTQQLPETADGTMRYRYPMGGTGAGDTTIGNFDFQVSVDGRTVDPGRVDEVKTPMLDLQREVVDGHLRLSHRARGYVPTHELGVDLPAPAPAVVTHVDRDGQAYFMMHMRPTFTPATPTAVDYAFVVDRSHGTAPELWAAASGLVRASIDGLGADDRFTVLACDTACDRAGPGLMNVSSDTKGEVERFLSSQPLGGASDIGGMLEAGAAALAPRAGADRVVVYLGDGVASSGELAADDIVALTRRETLAGVRVQAVAMGARADALLLGAVTRSSGGDLISVGVNDDLERVARELQLRARVPAFGDLQLDLPAALYDVHPRILPALRPGEGVTVVGKIRPDAWGTVSGDAVLRRTSTGEQTRQPVQIDWSAPRQHPYLPRAWAAEEIGWLTTTAGHEAKTRIVQLSEDYTVMSRYTALLVLENDAMYRQHRVARRHAAKDRWRGELQPIPGGVTARLSGGLKLGGGGATSTASQVAADASKPAMRGQVPLDDLTAARTPTGGSANAWPTSAPEAAARPAEPEAEPIEEDRLAANAKTGTRGRESRNEAMPKDAADDWFDEDEAKAQGGEDLKASERERYAQLEKSRDENAQARPEAQAQTESAAPATSSDNRGRGDWLDPFPGVPPAGAAPEADPEPADFDFEEDEDAGDWAAFPGEKTPSKKKKGKSTSKKPAPRPSSKAPAALDDAFGGDDGGSGGGRLGTAFGGSGYGGGPYTHRPRPRPPRPRLRVRPVDGPSTQALDQLARLLARRDGNRDDRARHRALVTAAMRAGDPRAAAWAAEWAEADPDHASAITARADALHRDGHAMASRAYESAAEASPFDRKLHKRLASALESKQRWERACSHRRAVVSIDPARGDAWAELARCLAQAGDPSRGRERLQVGLTRARTQRGAIDRALRGDQFALPAEPSLAVRADVHAELTWSGPADLDIVLVDARGRRLSAMRPEGSLAVRERPGHEVLTWRKLKKSVVVEVTRADGGTDPVNARLVIKTPDGRRSFDLNLTRGSQRLARVYRK